MNESTSIYISFSLFQAAVEASPSSSSLDYRLARPNILLSPNYQGSPCRLLLIQPSTDIPHGLPARDAVTWQVYTMPILDQISKRCLARRYLWNGKSPHAVSHPWSTRILSGYFSFPPPFENLPQTILIERTQHLLA
jgi:hypothetical protein